MKITNIEIAESAWCTEGAVRQAIRNGRLKRDSLDSILGYVMIGRLKASGIGFIETLPAEASTARPMVVASDLPFEEPTVDYSNSQESDESEY